MSELQPGGYAGDVAANAAWDDLKKNSAAVLVDVRSKAEWTYVGVPDLSTLGRDVLFVSWDEYPSGPIPDFAGRLKAALDAKGINRDQTILFLCRSGGRSRLAATAATGLGYTRAFNITEGFEGQLDPQRHRGGQASWKGAGLPWVQS